MVPHPRPSSGQGGATGALRCSSVIEQRASGLTCEQLLSQTLELALPRAHRPERPETSSPSARRRLTSGGLSAMQASSFFGAGKLRANLGQLVARFALAITQVLEAARAVSVMTRAHRSGPDEPPQGHSQAPQHGRDGSRASRPTRAVHRSAPSARRTYLSPPASALLSESFTLASSSAALSGPTRCTSRCSRVAAKSDCQARRSWAGGVDQRRRRPPGPACARQSLPQAGCTRVLELLDHATTLMLGARDLATHVGQARHHVVARFSSSRRISELMRPTTSCIWRRCSWVI